MICRTLSLLFLVSLAMVTARGATQEEEIEALEKKFYDSDLEIRRTLSEVPDDVLELLCTSFKCNFSDFGDWWNQTDVIYGDEPLGQHLYTGLSESIAAVLYQRGGMAGPHRTLMLMNRDSDWACLYGIPGRYGIVDNMRVIQKALFPPPKGSTFKCRVKHLSDQ